MSKKVSYDDITFSSMIQLDALLQLLVEKGVITRDEYSQRVDKVHKEYLERTKLRDAGDNPSQ